MNLEDFVAKIKEELPHIKPFEDDDYAIEEGGKAAFVAGDFGLAEKKFKELMLAQPKHHAGYEYLALLYSRTGKWDLAVMLQQEAVKIAKTFLQDDTIDIEVIQEMEENLNKIKDKENIKAWWGNM